MQRISYKNLKAQEARITAGPPETGPMVWLKFLTEQGHSLELALPQKQLTRVRQLCRVAHGHLTAGAPLPHTVRVQREKPPAVQRLRLTRPYKVKTR